MKCARLFWPCYSVAMLLFAAVALVGVMANHTITVRAVEQTCLAPAVVAPGALSANPIARESR